MIDDMGSARTDSARTDSTRRRSLRARFRHFRWTRPFWGGGFVIAGGVIIGWFPLGPLNSIVHAGIGGLAGFACAAILIVLGLLIWFAPTQRISASIIAVIVALASFPLSNFGGFVAGMMSGIIGGSLAFGWVPDKHGPVRKQPSS